MVKETDMLFCDKRETDCPSIGSFIESWKNGDPIRHWLVFPSGRGFPVFIPVARCFGYGFCFPCDEGVEEFEVGV